MSKPVGPGKRWTTASLGALSAAAIVSDIAGGAASNSLALQIGAAHLATGLYVQATPYLSNASRIHPSGKLLYGLVLIGIALLLAGLLYAIFRIGHRVLHPTPVQGTLMAIMSLPGVVSAVLVSFFRPVIGSSSEGCNEFWIKYFEPLAAVVLLILGVGIGITGQFGLDAIAALGLILMLVLRLLAIQLMPSSP